MKIKLLIMGGLILAVIGFAIWQSRRKSDQEAQPETTRSKAPAPVPEEREKIKGKTRAGIETIHKKSSDLLGTVESAVLPIRNTIDTVAGITNRPFEGPTIENFRRKRLTRTLQ